MGEEYSLILVDDKPVSQGMQHVRASALLLGTEPKVDDFTPTTIRKDPYRAQRNPMLVDRWDAAPE